MPAMQGLLKQSFTLEQFRDYLKKEVAPRIAAWTPEMIVLHEAGAMIWPGFDAHGVKLMPAQRIDNISVTWVANGFSRAPHLLLSCDSETGEALVHTLWPLWEHGTHSPSWNKVSWGIEQTGDFTKNPYPNSLKHLATEVMKALYAMIGLSPNEKSFHLHKEDPATTHKRCTGPNAPSKFEWLSLLNTHITPVPHSEAHKEHLVPSEFFKAKLKGMEDFREHAYELKGIWHIGWGFRDGFRGLHVDATTTMTREAADKLFEESVAIQADTIQQMIHVPITQYQLDGLQLLAWNIGLNALSGSTVIKRINASDFAGAGEAFEMWNKWRETEGGPLEVSLVLAARRKTERAIFDGKTSQIVIAPTKPVLSPATPLPSIPAPAAHNPAPMAPHVPIKPPDKVLDAMPLWGTFVVWILSFFQPRQAALGTTLNQKGNPMALFSGFKTYGLSLTGIGSIITAYLGNQMPAQQAVVYVFALLIAMALRSGMSKGTIQLGANAVDGIAKVTDSVAIDNIATIVDQAVAKALATAAVATTTK